MKNSHELNNSASTICILGRGNGFKVRSDGCEVRTKISGVMGLTVHDMSLALV